MTSARRTQFDASRPTWVHCTSRCVRRAFLAGDQFEHRKAWIEDRLQYLSGCFAMEVAGYAVMSNHLHVIVRMSPDLPQGWSDLEVARRWLSIYPKNYLADGTPVIPSEVEIASLAKDGLRVATWRKRLADLDGL